MVPKERCPNFVPACYRKLGVVHCHVCYHCGYRCPVIKRGKDDVEEV